MASGRPIGDSKCGLERTRYLADVQPMGDTPLHGDPADVKPLTLTEAALLAALAESEAEAEAGLFVSGDEIMRELRESIARMEGRAKPGRGRLAASASRSAHAVTKAASSGP